MTVQALLENGHSGPQEQRRATKTCSVEGCGRDVLARSWCRAHYQRWWGRGSVRPDIPISRQGGTDCSIEGCGRRRQHVVTGYCNAHQHRYKRHGSAMAHIPIKDVQMRPDSKAIVPTEPLRAFVHRLGLTVKGTWPPPHRFGRYIYRPALSFLVADEMAISLGHHPVEVWPNWYELGEA